MEDYNKYLKYWCDLYIHFCWHKSKTPKEITDKVLFKKEFTYERWKQGFHTYTSNKSMLYKFGNTLEGVELKENYIRLTYNLYKNVPFNIKYELI